MSCGGSKDKPPRSADVLFNVADFSVGEDDLRLLVRVKVNYLRSIDNLPLRLAKVGQHLSPGLADGGGRRRGRRGCNVVILVLWRRCRGCNF